MTVGNQLSSGQVNALISNLATGFRNLSQAAVNLSTEINGQGDGLATLEAAGFDSTDAAQALTAIGYFNTVAGVWFGVAAQPGEFNFNNATSPYWGGQ